VGLRRPTNEGWASTQSIALETLQEIDRARLDPLFFGLGRITRDEELAQLGRHADKKNELVTNREDDTKVLLPSMAQGLRTSLDPAKRARSMMGCLEEAMVGLGYVPLGYISIAAFKNQLEHDASIDPVEQISDWKIVVVLHSLLREKYRPAGLDVFCDELVRVAPRSSKGLRG
jgi:hypothetical protein